MAQETTQFDWETSLKAAIRVGISLRDYNEMTPYVLSLHIEAYNEKQKADQKDLIIQAYLTAAWSRSTKRMPDFKKIIGQEPQKSKEQTPEEMLEEVKKLNAAMGGTTY